MPANTSLIHPVILSGGSGTRLWPLSRHAYPKQLLALTGQHTLLQDTALRAARLPGAKAPLVVTSQEQVFLLQDQLHACGCAPSAVFIEPEGRNTAPALALAALHLSAFDPDALMLVLPADHFVQDQPAFEQAVAAAVGAAHAGWLCTFGVTPSTPETGYGYIQAGLAIGQLAGVQHVDGFVEKPDLAAARQLIQSAACFWNSGMFVFSAKAYLTELALWQPDVLTAVTLAWDGRHEDAGTIYPQSAAWAACPAISIDYAVMQSTRQAAVVQARFGWNDIGNWDSLWCSLPHDESGNHITGDVVLAGTTNSLVHAGHRLVSVVGLDNVAVVETADAVLVINKDKAQDIRQVVTQLQATNRHELLSPARVLRPWGWYEVTDSGERFQVKRLMVEPGRRLSMQLHHHRAEHWVALAARRSLPSMACRACWQRTSLPLCLWGKNIAWRTLARVSCT